MVNKIIPIVIDDNNRLCKALTLIDVNHLYFSAPETGLDAKLRTGRLKFFKKMFLTSSRGTAIMIIEKFPDHPVYYIGDSVDKLPAGIERFADVNEPIFRHIAEGEYIYSAKDMMKITSENNEFKYCDIEIILSGNADEISSLTHLKRMIASVRANRIIGTEYAVENVTTNYCGKRKDFLIKYLNIDNFFETDNSIQSDHIFNRDTDIYDLVDMNKYTFYWKPIKDYLQNRYADTNQTLIYADINQTLILIIDIAKINPKCVSLDLSDQISNIMNNQTNGSEYVYTYKDIVAFGTSRVMKYYMTLYDVYGMYRFGTHDSVTHNDGLFTKEEYQRLSDKMVMMSVIQLYEHLYSFTDVVTTRILPLTDDRIIKKSKDIVLVTYFGIYEQFIFVKDILERLGFRVHDFPYVRIINEHSESGMLERMKNMIRIHKPEYILWWVFNISPNNLYQIVKMNQYIKHIYFNWDEPFNWDRVETKYKAKYIDIAFITCSETIEKYKNAGTQYVYCLYPGHSPELHKPYWLTDTNIGYQYDISFICTNLYENEAEYPDQIINRKKLVDTIYNNQKNCGYNFAIFGPDKFQDQYPESYKGFINYTDTPEIFNKSKINICTHVVGNKSGYLNERIFLILASGGLLMVDPVPGVGHILTNGINCIFINEQNILEQIKQILKNYKYYDRIKKNAYESSRSYTWDDWGMRLYEKILKHFP